MDFKKDIFPYLQEIRRRVFRIVIAIGVITGFLLGCHLNPIDVYGITLYYPTLEPLHNVAAQITNHMRGNLVPDSVQLIQTAPGQAFFSQVYIAALVGIVASIPIIIREFVGFLKPALKDNEIKVGRSITAPAVGIFITGCIFAYIFVVPFILDFLYKYGESAGLITFLNILDFVSFVLQFLLAFGLSFQLPLIMYALSASGMVDYKFWRTNMRYAVIGIVIFGAVITPDGSGVTMWFIGGQMLVLYFAGMFVIERRGRRKAKVVVKKT